MKKRILFCIIAGIMTILLVGCQKENKLNWRKMQMIYGFYGVNYRFLINDIIFSTLCIYPEFMIDELW